MVKYLIHSIFLLCLFISPFVFWPGGEVAYEVPRVWFILRWIEVMAALGIIATFEQTEAKKKDVKLIVLVLVFGLAALIASLLGSNLTKSIWGNFYRVDGLFTLFHLTGLFFILMLYWDKSWERLTALSIAVGAIIVSLMLLIADITTFGQPNFLAGYLLISIPFIVYLFENSSKKIRYIWTIGIIPVLLALVTTGAKGAFLGVGIYLLVRLLLYKNLSRKKIFGILLICLIPIVIFFWFQSQGREFVAESRERLITKGVLAFAKRPVLGWGWANFDHAFDSVEWPIRLEHDVYADKAHSTLLEVLVAAGIIGFLSYIALLWRLFERLFTMKGPFGELLFLTALIFIIHAQTNVISIAEELIFWVILGIVAASYKQKTFPDKAAV